MTQATYQELAAELRRYVHRRLGDHGVAEDIAQESVFRLWLRLQEAEELEHPRAWVFRTAHNLAVDLVRRNLPPTIGIEASRGLLDPATETPDEALFPTRHGDWPRSDLLQWVPSAMADLAVPYQRILTGHYHERLSCSELAEREGISHDNVKVRLHRARKHLQALLERQVAAVLERTGGGE